MMFGFSIAKLIILGAAVAAAWYGIKYIGRLQDSRGRDDDEARLRNRGRGRSRRGGTGESAVEEMEPCPICGVFVSPKTATPCGHVDCPYS